jgi:hypothetical protein
MHARSASLEIWDFRSGPTMVDHQLGVLSRRYHKARLGGCGVAGVVFNLFPGRIT